MGHDYIDELKRGSTSIIHIINIGHAKWCHMIFIGITNYNTKAVVL